MYALFLMCWAESKIFLSIFTRPQNQEKKSKKKKKFKEMKIIIKKHQCQKEFLWPKLNIKMDVRQNLGPTEKNNFWWFAQ